jgi:hypothetical protein
MFNESKDARRQIDKTRIGPKAMSKHLKCPHCGEFILPHQDAIWSSKARTWVHKLCEGQLMVMLYDDLAEEILADLGYEPHRPAAITRGGEQIPADDGWEKTFLGTFGIDWKTGH